MMICVLKRYVNGMTQLNKVTFYESIKSIWSQETGLLLSSQTVNHPKHKLHMFDMQRNMSSTISNVPSEVTACSVEQCFLLQHQRLFFSCCTQMQQNLQLDDFG